MLRAVCLAGWHCVACLAFAVTATADEPPPLHEQIDALMAESPLGVAAPLADDAEFLRRVSLDLVGMPPTAEEARAFLADESPEKRARAIDRLLDDPRHARFMAISFDVMFMERRPAKHVDEAAWLTYLLESFRANKPYNQLATELLTADGDSEALRPAARFVLDREGDPHLLTRDVGRIFFGRDLQCAQCHDHPLIDGYLQRDYHGLLACFAGGSVVTKGEGDQQTAYYQEQPAGDAEFESVFVPGKHLTSPLAPTADPLAATIDPPGEEFVETEAEVPDLHVRQVKFSPRRQIAEQAASGGLAVFNENIANRLWAQMLGRGLVEPVDLHHPDNPATHPELLRLLGEQFAAGGYDTKSFLREIALSDAYQRSIDLSADAAEADRAPLQSRFEDQEREVEEAGSAFDEARKGLVKLESEMVPLAAEFQAARKAAREAVSAQQAAIAARDAVSDKLTSSRGAAELLEIAVAKSAEAVALLGDDEALAAAAKAITDRHAGLVGELEQLEKELAEKQTAAEAAEKASSEAVAALVPIQEKYIPARAELLAAEESVAASRGALDQAEAHLAATKAELKFIDLQLAWQAADAELAAAKRQLQELPQLVAQLQAKVEPLTRELLSASDRRDQAASELEAVSATVSQQREKTNSLANVVQRLETAHAALTVDVGAPSEVLAAAAAAVEQQQSTAQAAWQAETAALSELQGQVAAARARLEGAQAAWEERRAACEQAVRLVAEKQAESESLGELVAERTLESDDAWSELAAAIVERGGAAQLKHLSPEQLCFSMLQATGVYGQTWKAKADELAASEPLPDDADDAQRAERSRRVEQLVFAELQGRLAAFRRVYASAAGQPQDEFFATVDQALFAANGPDVNGWVDQAAAAAAKSLQESHDARAVSDEVYLAVLGRMPTADESNDSVEYLASAGDDAKPAARELVWALLTSVEFRFNH